MPRARAMPARPWRLRKRPASEGKNEIDEKIGQEAQTRSSQMPPELPKSATRRSAIGFCSPNQHKLRRMGLGKGPNGGAARQALQRE
jgi:hypothetical protein